MTPRDRITNAIRCADLGLAIARLEQELLPHHQRLDSLRREYQQALQAHADSAPAPESSDDPAE